MILSIFTLLWDVFAIIGILTIAGLCTLVLVFWAASEADEVTRDNDML